MRSRTVIVSAAILLLFTVLPILGQGRLPEELYTYLSKTSGIDLRALLNEVAVLGFLVASTFILGDLFEKNTVRGLIVSSVNRVIWLIVIVSVLSFGDISHIGFITIGSGSGTSFNMVAIDLRFFVILIAIIIAMKIVCSVLEYRKSRYPLDSKADAIKT